MNQTREEKVEMFDKNQEKETKDHEMFTTIKTEKEKTKNIFLELLDKHKCLYVVDKPRFMFNNKEIFLKSAFVDHSEIIESLLKFDTIFIQSMIEVQKPAENYKIILLRYAGLGGE